ncbi:MAG: hypothetical protein V3T84_02275 [Phycisphaerales bacterium]
MTEPCDGWSWAWRRSWYGQATGLRFGRGNGTVGASDLLALLANWGPCP